jgi:hypothetical protein
MIWTDCVGVYLRLGCSLGDECSLPALVPVSRCAGYQSDTALCQRASTVETAKNTGYTVDVQVLLSGDERPIVVEYGDNTIISNGVVSKARRGGQRNSILLKMDGIRMWEFFPSELIESDNTPFEQKWGSAVWRGATTGTPLTYFDEWAGPRHQRAALVRKIPSLKNVAHIDVAVSHYVQHIPANMFGKPSKLALRDLVKHQMLIVAEGNGK